MLQKVEGLIRYLKYSRYRRIYMRFKNHTMVSIESYIQNLLITEKIRSLKGDIIECGTWKGGMIAGIAMNLGNKRTYHLYDSFEGLPPVKEVDGKKAAKWQKDIASPIYYDNCFAEMKFAEEAMQISGVENYFIHKGWFENTVSNYSGAPIALLRLDGDWYDSTMVCLRQLFPYLVKGGIVIIDDYYAWEGCSKAVHDFLSENGSDHQIRQFNNRVCYILN